MFFATCSWKTAANSAVIHPKKECLPPSCSSRTSALDDIVFITQSLNMAAKRFETTNNFKMSSNSVLLGLLSLELSIQNCSILNKLSHNVNKKIVNWPVASAGVESCLRKQIM